MTAPSDDAAYCAELVRGHDFDRYASTLYAPAETRRALLSIYAFNVEIIRIRGLVSQPLPGEIRLQWWTDALAGIGHGSVEGNPAAAELMRTIETYHLPVEPLQRLIEARHFDLYNDPMPDMARLEAYLADTCSGLFAMAALVLGERSDAATHAAHHAGIAQGIADVVASLPSDAARQQLFLPQQRLDESGAAVADIFAGKSSPHLRSALDQLIADARAHLDQANDLIATLPKASRGAFLALALTRFDLASFTRASADPFQPARRSHLRTLWTLWRASHSARL